MSIEIFLRERREQILDDWKVEAGAIAASLGQREPALARALPRLIEDFARFLAGERGLAESVANDCSAEVLGHAVPLSQLVQELGLFRRCVLRWWHNEHPAGLHAEAAQTAADIDAVIERIVDRYLAMRTSLLDGFERIALSALTAPDLDGFLRELLTIFASFAPSVESLAIFLREGDRLTLHASIGPLPIVAAAPAMPLGQDFANLGCYGVRLVDEEEVVGVALAGMVARTDIPVPEKRLFALVAQRAAAAIVKHRLRADATKRTAELDAFIQAIPSPIYLGTAGGFSNANRAGLDLVGVASTNDLKRLSVAEVVERIQLRAVRGEPVALDENAFGRALRGEHVSMDCWAQEPRTGEPRLYRCSAGPVIVDGRLDGAVLVMSDLTEIKRAEDRFRTMFERIPMAIAQSDPATGRVVRTNAKMCELTGRSLEELVGHAFAEWTHPDDRAENLEQYGQLIRGELEVYTTEKRYVRKDGSIIWVRVTASLLPSPGEPPRTLATIEDITARRSAEVERERLMVRERAAAERLRILAEVTRALSEARLDLDRLLNVIAEELIKQIASGCVIYLASDDFRILEPVACRHVDPTAQALLRRAVSPSISVGEGLSGRAAATGQTIALGDGSLEELLKLASQRFHEFNARVETQALVCAPLKVTGRVLGVLVVIRDKTAPSHATAMSSEDRLLVEEIADRAALAIDGARLLVREHEARADAERAQAELARAAEFRERFIGIVSHDLRNPLGAILMASEILSGTKDLPDGFAVSLHRITSAAHRMHDMIEELLDFTRGRLGGGIPIEPKRTDLGPIVRRVIDELELAFPSRCIVLDVSGTVEGWFDEERLAQVASNLIGNALQHSPPDTEIVVSLVDRGDAGVVLEVTNGGAAIRPEFLPHLFEPFRRDNKDRSASAGLGLGLFIVAEVVRAHGGTIRVASTAAAGTTFTVVLPRESLAGNRS